MLPLTVLGMTLCYSIRSRIRPPLVVVFALAPTPCPIVLSLLSTFLLRRVTVPTGSTEPYVQLLPSARA